MENKETKSTGQTKSVVPTSIINSFIAGAFSGTCSTILLQPFDLIKTRMQQSPSLGLIKVTRDIARTEGVSSFWTGVTPSLWRTVPGIGLHFSFYHCLSSNIISSSGQEHLSSLQSLTVGVLARVMAGTVLIPATVIKTRWEAAGPVFHYKGQGMLSAARSIVRVEGARGLVSGLVPTIVRDAPYSGIYLLFYNKLKQVGSVSELTSSNERSAGQFVCGIVAGCVATIIVQPADVLKTEMQLSQDRVSQRSVARTVYRDRGLQGFYVGLIPRIIRKSLMSALAWTVYERVSERMLKL